MKRLLAVFVARNREFLRDKSTLTWNLLFPFLLLVGFYYAFGQAQPLYKIGVLSEQDAYLAKPDFFSLQHLQTIPYPNLEAALEKLNRQRIDLLIDLDSNQYWVNDESANGYMAEQLLIAKDPYYQRNRISGSGIRYVDWVLPGIIAMNLMFSALFGVGYVIVRYRKNGVLKRLNATPLRAWEFIAAQMLSRLVVVVFLCSVVLFGAQKIFATLFVGSWWLVVLFLILGILSMSALGLVVAARLRSEEFTSGLINMATWPMLGLSEVWFPLDGAPLVVNQISSFLPLTHIVQGMREVMIDGAGLAGVADHLVVLAAMTAVFMTVGSLMFDWRSDGR